MGKRIALAGFYHETNTFSSLLTTYSDFQNYQFAEGVEIINSYSGTGTEPGGIIGEAAQRDMALLPLLFASAVPSGTIEAACLKQITNQITDGLRQLLPIDGMLVVLHGAAVAEGFPDADAYVLQQIRDVLGPEIPLVATTDFHANISTKMVRSANAIVGYDTFPHVDMASRGAEAVEVLDRLLAGQHFFAAYRKLPLVTAPQCQPTAEQPMQDIMAQLHACEAGHIDGICTGTIAMGFAYADTPDLGASVLVYGSSNQAVESTADQLARLIWSRRAEFVPELTSLDEVEAAFNEPSARPLILVDPADNIGGGSAGDGTAILRLLLDHRPAGSVIVINDPDAVSLAQAAGPGRPFSALVGGKVDSAHGPPVQLEGTVRQVGEAKFRHSGSYMTGFVTSMGLTAVIDAAGVQVVLTSRRTMPFDIEQLRCLGIEPHEQNIIVVKSAIAWRAAYGEIAGTILTVDTPGLCPSNLNRLDYRLAPGSLYPLDKEAKFSAGDVAA